jgi:Ser/Thr protein kinase RdoA (MazF antagonist)
MMIDETDTEGLAVALSERFGLGRPTGPLTSVDRGFMGQVWQLTTETGRWAAKMLFEGADPAAAEQDVRLQEAALASGIGLPRPRRATDGAVVVVLGERSWRLHEWRDLPPVPELPAPPAVAAELGSALARLHGLALPAAGGVPGWFTEAPAPEYWAELVGRATEAGCSWTPALEAAVPVFAELGSMASGPETVPPSVLCHRDLVANNVRSAPDGALLIIDWDHAGPLPAEWELGYVLLQWCFRTDGGVDFESAGTILEAYRAQSGRPVEVTGGTLLPAARAWLNFTTGTVAHAVANHGADGEELRLATLDRLLTHPLSRPALEALTKG